MSSRRLIRSSYAGDRIRGSTTFTYDGANGGFSSNTAGRLSQASYAGPHGLQCTELYSYHAAGALTAKRLGVSGTALGTNTESLDAAYSYDTLGNAASVQYPFAQWANGAVVTAGPQYNYSYDAMHRIAGMTGPNNQTLVSSVTYNPAN